MKSKRSELNVRNKRAAKVLTLKDAAAVVGVPAKVMFLYANTGELPVFKRGNSTCIAYSELIDWCTASGITNTYAF